MSTEVLRRAHMSAIRSNTELNDQIKKLEFKLQCSALLMNYLIERLKMHGSPTSLDTGVLTLAGMAMTTETDNGRALACNALALLMQKGQEVVGEVQKDLRDGKISTIEDALHEIDKRIQSWRASMSDTEESDEQTEDFLF